MTAKLTKTMADAIESAVKAKVEATNKRMWEMELAMAGMRESNRVMTEKICAMQSEHDATSEIVHQQAQFIETLQNRHAIAMHIVADKSNTIRILTGDVAHLRNEVTHYRLECERFEKARNYWRQRYAYMSNQFFRMLNRLADWETYLGIMPRKDSWDFSEVEDYSQEN